MVCMCWYWWHSTADYDKRTTTVTKFGFNYLTLILSTNTYNLFGLRTHSYSAVCAPGQRYYNYIYTNHWLYCIVQNDTFARSTGVHCQIICYHFSVQDRSQGGLNRSDDPKLCQVHFLRSTFLSVSEFMNIDTKTAVTKSHIYLKNEQFGNLILRQIIKFFGTICQILRLKCIKFIFVWGSAYSAPQTH